MIISRHQSDIIKQIIQKTYSRDIDADFFKEITPDICRLVDIEYFAVLVFNNKNHSENLSVSNNPQEFEDVYMKMFDKDFILANMLETGKPAIFRELVEKNVPRSEDFVYYTQKTRPASDGCYVPIRIGSTITGFFGAARGGLRSRRFSKNDLDIFNFASSVIQEGLKKTLYLNTDLEDTAYINRSGEIISAGDRIKDAFRELFGEQYCEKTFNGQQQIFKNLC